MLIHPSSIHLICLPYLSTILLFICKTFICKIFPTISHFFSCEDSESFVLQVLVLSIFLFIYLVSAVWLWGDILSFYYYFHLGFIEILGSVDLALHQIYEDPRNHFFVYSNVPIAYMLDGSVDIWCQLLFPASPLLPLYVSDEVISHVLFQVPWTSFCDV